MIATFCLRLALGMVATLVVLTPHRMHPRFFRTHLLTVLALSLVAGVMSWGGTPAWLALLAAGLAFAGAIVWVFERAPLGWSILALTAAVLVTALVLPGLNPSAEGVPPLAWPYRLVDDLTSALLLGSGMTAMLVGHSYLISPGLSIQPLMHELAALGAGVVLRIGVAGAAFACWSQDHDATNLNDETVLYLPVRWLIGLFGPLLFGWLAYRTAKIRSTQSATGILYVVVILTFLGELIQLLIFRITGLPM